MSSGRDDLEPRVETCRIRLWKGYVTGTFYASLVDAAGEGESICEPSGSFRWRRRDVSDEAHAAHRDLVARLEAAGWTLLDGPADPWYAATFTRTVLAPREVPAEEEDEWLDEVEPAEELPEPPEPRPPAPAHRPAPAAEPPRAASARTRLRLDAWRLAAAVGLVATVAVAIWLAVHDGVALP